MPKTLKRVVYDGHSDVYYRDFGSKKIALRRGYVTIVPDDIHAILMDGKKKAHIVNVIGIEDKRQRKLKDRLILEDG